MILQVHDELVFDVQRSELDALKALVVEEMENASPLSSAIGGGYGCGRYLVGGALSSGSALALEG